VKERGSGLDTRVKLARLALGHPQYESRLSQSLNNGGTNSPQGEPFGCIPCAERVNCGIFLKFYTEVFYAGKTAT